MVPILLNQSHWLIISLPGVYLKSYNIAHSINLIADLRFSAIYCKFKFLSILGFLQPIYRVLRKISNYRKNFWTLFHQFHQNFSSKWFDVNKITIVNSLVLHILHRDIAHLAIKTGKSFLKMEVLVQEECKKFQIAVTAGQTIMG